jgi:tetratricopeptide (TPR) repeat protein
MKLAHYGEAWQALRRAVELQPDNMDAIAKLADLDVAFAMGNPAKGAGLLGEVKKLSDKLIQLNPDSFDGHRLRGTLAFQGKDYSGAIVEFEKANEAYPDQASVVLAYFEALALSNRFPEAEKLAQHFIEKTPKYLPMYDLLAVNYKRQNKVAAAEALMRLKAANNPERAK